MKLTFILEVIGTITFAFSGALVAIDHDLDMFGITCMAVVTATGGGMTRDIILGNTPPMMFRNPIYVGIAVVVAFLTAGIYRWLSHSAFKKRILDLINALDAVGLAIFTIVGMNLAMELGFESIFLVCFVGVLSAVGGGLLRDIMVNRKPVILTKEVYATASMVGSVLYFFSLKIMPGIVASALSILIIFGLRLWALFKDINLPIIDKE